MKKRLEDLAILGGEPLFTTPVRTGTPNITDRVRLFSLLSEMLDRNWLSNGGPLVRQFEDQVAELSGVKHCVAMCNATVALHVLLRALNLSGEVVMPSLTFPATAHAAAWLGLDPVFCDVDRRTANLDPARTAEALNSRTSAIMGVHLWGRPADAEGLSAVAADRKLPLLFDAAHAIGCTAGGRPVGQLGLASVFSFHATKVVSAFEGGALVTDDSGLAEEVRALQNFGFAADQTVRAVGTNGKMSEAAAAMGLTSLDSFDHVVTHNEGVYDTYLAGLAGVPGLSLGQFDRAERNNFQYVLIEIDPEVASRDDVQAVLAAENVHTKRYFAPGCHELAPYRDRHLTPLPHTEAIAARVLALPTGTGVGSDQAERICDVIRLVMQRTERAGTGPRNDADVRFERIFQWSR
ncbi:DegT/DnrJ/EryC1/StrS family aminotransferase [Micromonospora echinospora]|uniref:DegT/DnrJ/EryC1/StrS family aminotransferase n=1 Tax=Micromonospora echinospora TaxID=1877 RepID=UPI0034427710